VQPLFFVTRHPPTDDQRRLAAREGYEDLIGRDLDFGNDPAADLRQAGIVPPGPVALVAPLWVGLALLRAGFTVIEFVNDTAARTAGSFVCRGLWVHDRDGSRFIPAGLP
jgi:hypothetical protein